MTKTFGVAGFVAGLAALAVSCYLTTEAAALSELDPAALEDVKGAIVCIPQGGCPGNQNQPDFQCWAAQTCTQMNFNPAECIFAGEGADCCRCSSNAFDYTCVVGGAGICRLGQGGGGYVDCGTQTTGTCSGAICTGTSVGSVPCPCDARVCDDD